MVQRHFPIHNITEQICSAVRADGDKIRTELGIIPRNRMERRFRWGKWSLTRLRL